jgi:hypothetical protein
MIRRFDARKALTLGEGLKDLLEERLLGTTSGARCRCGSCGPGPSKVVGVSMPPVARQFGDTNLWSCLLNDDQGRPWTASLATCLPVDELVSLFTETFESSEIKVRAPEGY